MSEKINEAEVINPNSVTLNDTGKSFEIVTKCTDPEQLFLDKRNFVPMLEQCKLIARGLVADATTKEGVATRKALNRKLASLKTLIDEEGKKVSDALKKKPNIILATRKEVRDTLEMLQEEVMKPVKDIEARQNEIIEISNLPASAIGCDSFGIQDVINVLETKAHDEAYWKESYADAMAATNEARRQLNAMLDSALKLEEQQREYERLKAEEEKRNRQLAEEAAQAKAEAEEAKRKAEEAKRAQEKAEADARAAAESEARAKADAELAKKQAEEAKATVNVVESGNAAQVLRDAEETKSQMLFADDKAMYVKMCKTEAKEDLMNCGLNEEQARDVVIAILTGKVRHVAMMF